MYCYNLLLYRAESQGVTMYAMSFSPCSHDLITCIGKRPQLLTVRLTSEDITRNLAETVVTVGLQAVSK